MQDEITKGGETDNPFWTDEFGQELKKLGGDKCVVFNDRLLLEDFLQCPGHDEWEHLGDGYVLMLDARLLKESFLETHFNDMTWTKTLLIFVTGEGDVYSLHHSWDHLLEAKMPQEALDCIKTFLKAA